MAKDHYSLVEQKVSQKRFCARRYEWSKFKHIAFMKAFLQAILHSVYTSDD